MPAAAPLSPTGDLLVRCDRRVLAAGGGEFSFDVVARGNPAARLESLELVFPGFKGTAPAAGLPDGGVRLRGRLRNPGFYPLVVSAGAHGRRLTGRDYFVVPEAAPVPATHEAGYYVFLGCGDYALINGQETHALAGWSLGQWKELITWMGANGMNRLWTLVNGYTLAYPSRRYPALCDRHAQNVKANFLGELIEHAHGCGVKVYLMLSTDGHARDFSRAHPGTARLNAQGEPDPQFGLALEHPLTRRFILGVLDEVLELYPQADGVAVHPTESDPDRFNPETLAAYRDETGRNLRDEPPDIRRAWHNLAFARFLREFAVHCHQHNPALELIMANCWWQDDHVALNRAELPPSIRIAVWHYAWEDTEAKPWPVYRWVGAFGPERIIYLPTSQSYLYPAEAERVMDRHIGTDRLVSTARLLDVRNTMYFAGWDILPEEARLLDVALVRHPTAALDAAASPALIPRLYSDYFAVRAELMPRQP